MLQMPPYYYTQNNVDLLGMYPEWTSGAKIWMTDFQGGDLSACKNIYQILNFG